MDKQEKTVRLGAREISPASINGEVYGGNVFVVMYAWLAIIFTGIHHHHPGQLSLAILHQQAI